MFNSLRTRLIAVCIFIVIVAMTLVAVVNFDSTRRHTLALLDHQMEQIAQAQSNAIGAWLRSKQAAVASIVPAAGLPDVLPALKAAERAGDFDQTYLGYPDKRAVFSQERSRPDYDPTQRDWYKRAADTGEAVITKPYIGVSTGKLLITFAAPVGGKGGVTAVAGADVLLDTVVASVLSIKPTPSSYAFLVDADGTVIAHPDKAFALKPVSSLSPALTDKALAAAGATAAGDAGLRLDLGGRDVLLYAETVPGTKWRLAIALDRDEATEALRSILVISVIATLVFALLAAALLHWVVSKYLHRLQSLRAAIAAAGDGDFTHRLSVRGSDELTEIADAFNRFADNIDVVLQKIRVASASVRTASEEIASGNLDLSQRTEQQAGSLGETASSVNKLTGTVKQNADNADQANRLAASASEVAVKGGVVVAGVVSIMGSINDSSKKVVDIIGVIDSIAFQTNILALNAAVEAARAGAQGRGFAVVATEVRSLAQRSAEAAKEIKALIGDSVAKIDNGSELVTEAGNTMNEIVESVKRVTGIMGEITMASKDQTAEIEQINQAIAQMDNGTQQNAAMVEQAAAAAASLQEQAASLSHALSVFRLGQKQPE